MRKLVGIVLILHGLAHAGAGMWSTGPVWLVTIAWLLATTSFMAAGFGFIGVPVFRRGTRDHVYRGSVASLVLLAYLPHLLLIPGVLLDLLFVAMVSAWQGIDAPRDEHIMPQTSGGRIVFTGALLVLTYASAVIALRPWYMRMGTTTADRAAVLFGDSLNPGSKYRVDNAITIHAPADSVWPWVAQIGQDRGWHIVAMDTGRAIVLENRGAFIVRPIDDSTSKMQIRQRNSGTPSLLGVLLSPAGLLVFEPAHFIMQRAMLRGIRDRAERRV